MDSCTLDKNLIIVFSSFSTIFPMKSVLENIFMCGIFYIIPKKKRDE